MTSTALKTGIFSDLPNVDPLCIPDTDKSVVVAMSGGVDSSVAAHMLAEVGWRAIGVSMQVWDYRAHEGNEKRATCCSPADFCDARRVAGQVGIPYYVVDFEKTFREQVINRFVDSYRAGITPNPCIDCNNKVKFGELRERAKSFGCSHVATGHYARVKKSKDGFHLLRGIDDSKDQSYFLYSCTQDELAHTLFPVGHFTKAEIREFAKAAGLPTATKAESQDICFIGGSVHDFVTKIGGGVKKEGSIVSTNGAVLGKHDGITRFTVGQRKGLRIGGTETPLYVLEINPENNQVIVGEKSELEKDSFLVTEVNWVSPNLQKDRPKELEVVVQVRSRHRGVKARVAIQDNNQVTISWLGEHATVSPGQAAVFYDLSNQEVLGGGRIGKIPASFARN